MEHLERLPDPVVLLIVNAIRDVKALGCLSTTSARFRRLVPLVEDVSVKIERIVPTDDPGESGSVRRGVLGAVLRFMRSIVQPIQCILYCGPYAAALYKFANGALQSWRRGEAPCSLSVALAAQHSPSQILHRFSELRTLHIELPSSELGLDQDGILCWHAEFGTTLESCIILGAQSLQVSPPQAERGGGAEGLPTRSLSGEGLVEELQSTEMPTGADTIAEGTRSNGAGDGDGAATWSDAGAPAEGGAAAQAESPAGGELAGPGLDVDRRRLQLAAAAAARLEAAGAPRAGVFPRHDDVFTCKELKLRIVWTISSLIAAAGRHFLLGQIIGSHPKLQALVLTDKAGQGTLVMGVHQLAQYRAAGAGGAPDERPLREHPVGRTKVPALRMNLWYASSLPVADGRLQGATLVAIRQQAAEHRPAPELKHVLDVVGAAFPRPLSDSAESLIMCRPHFLKMKEF